jgi:ectoine hydroxylase-related dioxygenase (phytanoyl-CoA dioxygenase family)
MPVELSEKDLAQYEELGYVLLEGVLSAEKLSQLRAETEAIVRQLRAETEAIVRAAAGVEAHDDIYDLEDSHQATVPRVRRIKAPYLHFPFFADLARDPDLLDPLVPILGENIRLYGSKMNMKSAGYGAPVEWHQDWAFYPHSNNDVLTACLLLDDMDADNGALQVIPGSHRGPIHDHHHDGYFCGALDAAAARIDTSKAVSCSGAAGDMLIFHARIIHGSAVNSSNRQRRLLIHELTAADAWPLTGPKGSVAEFQSWVVRGEATWDIRVEDVPVRLPYPAATHQGSIYENQKGSGRRQFDVFEDRRAAT